MITQKIIARTDSLKLDKIISRYGEDSMRQVVFIIVRPDPDSEELIPITIPEDAIGSFRILKPSGNFVIVPMSKSVLASGETAFDVVLPASANTAKGSGYYDIRITSDTDKYYFTAQGDFLIDDNIISDDVLEDVSEVNGLIFPDDFLTVEDHVAYIDDDTISTDSTWSSNKINEEIEAHAGGDVSKTVSGNPITFTDGADAPLVKCVTAITGYQEGSGTPSPDNIRPIVAYTDGEIEVSDGDGNTTTHTTTYPYAIYRGSEDAVNGEVMSEWEKVVFDGSSDENWNDSSSGAGMPRFSIYISSAKAPNSRNSVVSNLGYWDSSSPAHAAGVIFIASDKKLYYYPPLPSGSRVSDFKTWLSNNQLEIAYERSTPTTSSVTPTNLPIKSLSGYNHIESSTGDMEVEYITSEYQPIVALIERNKHVYSTAEHPVGTWFDGNTVYEKTLYHKSLNVSRSDWSILDTITTDKFIDSSVTFTNNGRYLDKTYMRISYLNGNIYYHTPEINGTCDDVYVTIRYTKEV